VPIVNIKPGKNYIETVMNLDIEWEDAFCGFESHKW
jgi:hypothetical protein